ncbi:hypothetical protein POKO110462_21970 [Pontibacter korlensis]
MYLTLRYYEKQTETGKATGEADNCDLTKKETLWQA